MLTYSRLGKVGRLGNQLFQVAFITFFAKKYGIDYKLPYWKYAPHFDYPFSFGEDLDRLKYDIVTQEPGPGYYETHFVDLIPIMKTGNVNIITGYFQSYKYFEKSHVLNIFKPKTKIGLNVKKGIAISVRRGDFVKHKNYTNIEAETFRKLLDEFKGFKVFVFTDDFRYCRREFIGPQFEFLDGFDDIQQLQVLSKFQYFILSNSTFSYWGPMLNPDPKLVLYPQYMFPDLDRCEIYNKDYWPNNGCVYKMYKNEINK